MFEIRANFREKNSRNKRREGVQASHHSSSVPLDPGSDKIGGIVDRAMVDAVCSDDPTAQLKATTQLQFLLSTDPNAHIEEVVQSGVVPRFVKFLSRDDFPQLQLAAGWVLCRIAYGSRSENTREIVSHGAVPSFVNLLGSPNVHVLKMAALALGNIAADSPEHCDLVHTSGALSPLLSLLNNRGRSGMSEGWRSVIEQATSTLYRFCLDRESNTTRPALPILKELLLSKDERILKNACCTLHRLSLRIIDHGQAFLDVGICPMLVQLLLHSSRSVVIPTLDTVNNIACGGAIQKQSLIDHNVLPHLAALLGKEQDIRIRVAACAVVALITTGTEEQVGAVIEAGLIGLLIGVLKNAPRRLFREPAEIADSVVRATLRALCHASHEQICIMISQGVIKTIFTLWNSLVSILWDTIWKGLEKLVVAVESETAKQGVSKYAEMIDAEGDIEKIAVIKRKLLWEKNFANLYNCSDYDCSLSI